MTLSDNEWEQRTLCSDGNCIGIIGADGRCKVCGLPYDSELPLPETAGGQADVEAPDEPDPPSLSADDEQAGDEIAPDAQGVAQLDDDTNTWENRTLCIDESCIGVIGADGRCRECGKPYKVSIQK
jgi:hypothetical protein